MANDTHRSGFSLVDFFLHAIGRGKKTRSPFKSEREALEFCEHIYRETGGVTPELGAPMSSIGGTSMTIAHRALDLPKVKIIELGDDCELLRGFECGEAQIDDWAGKCHQMEISHRARAFCALMPGHDAAYGFYSLSLKGEAAKGLGDDILKAHNQGGYVPTDSRSAIPTCANTTH